MQYIIFAFVLLLGIAVFAYIRVFKTTRILHKAEELMEQEEYARASELVRTLLEKDRENVQARFMRAQLLMRQNQYLMAISELNTILGINDFNKYVRELDIHYLLADLYNKTKNWQKEIESYRIILNYNPEDVNANQRIGQAYYRQKNYKGAYEHFGRVLNQQPGMKDLFQKYGVASYMVSDYENAESYLTRSLDIEGDRSEAQFYLGNIFKMKKDYDNALSFLEKASKNRDYMLNSLYRMGEIYYEKEDYDKAIDIMEDGIKLLKDRDEESHAYRYLLAECYEYRNMIKEAMHHWEKIIQDNQNFRSTRMKLDSYRNIIEDENFSYLFTHSIEDIQPAIMEMIASLNYNIISREYQNQNEYLYKAYNTKRINDPPVLFYFSRTTREITEGEIINFSKMVSREKCKSGIFITTSKFSLRAKSSSANRGIELYGSEFVSKMTEKYLSKIRKAQIKPEKR